MTNLVASVEEDDTSIFQQNDGETQERQKETLTTEKEGEYGTLQQNDGETQEVQNETATIEKEDGSTNTEANSPNDGSKNGNKPETFNPNGQLKALTKLQLNLDRNRQMHRLAAFYFQFQHFWLLFVPSVTITMISGILAFLSDNDGLNLAESTKSIFSTIVGCSSVLSVFVQACIKELDYSHRAKMHNGVARDLKLMQDELEFQAIAARNGGSRSGKELPETVKSYEDKYDQVMSSCSSLLPSEIFNAYELVSTRMALLLFPPVKFCDSEALSKIDWVSVMGIVNNEAFNAFSGSFLWPLLMPKAEHVATKAKEKLENMLRNDLSQNLTLHQQENENNGHNVALQIETLNVYTLLLLQQKGITKTNELFLSETSPLLQMTTTED